MGKQRICVIGNSHAAAWRVGLDLVPGLNDLYDFDFFAAQSDLMREMALRGTILTPTAELTRRRMSIVSNGKVEIETADYSQFVIIGLGFTMVDAINILRSHQLYGFHKSDSDAVPYLSRPCFSALVDSILRNSTAIYFVRLLRKAGVSRVLLVPQPFPSEEILSVNLWELAAQSGALAYAAGVYTAAARKVAVEEGCELLEPPTNMLTKDFLTLSKYSMNSVRLSADMQTKHPQSEPFHMNDLYGAEMLKLYGEFLKA